MTTGDAVPVKHGKPRLVTVALRTRCVALSTCPHSQ